MNRRADLPVLEPSPTESLSERCQRFALQIADYEADLTDRAVLELTEIRKTLEAVAEALR